MKRGERTVQYITFAEDMDRGEVMLCGPVRPEEAAYLREAIAPRLQPLSKEDYANGPAAILQTDARWSYVLDGETAYWCVEWPPGLLVLQFTEQGPMQWTAVPSAQPETAQELALKNYDESEDDSQYRLVYEAWDAQFEGGLRTGWKTAPETIELHFEKALTQVRQVEDELETLYGSDETACERWMTACEASPIWQGKIPS